MKLAIVCLVELVVTNLGAHIVGEHHPSGALEVTLLDGELTRPWHEVTLSLWVRHGVLRLSRPGLLLLLDNFGEQVFLASDEEFVFKALLILGVASFGEVVHVKLPHKGREIVVLEVPGQDFLGELVGSVDDESVALRVPEDGRFVDGVLQKLVLVTHFICLLTSTISKVFTRKFGTFFVLAGILLDSNSSSLWLSSSRIGCGLALVRLSRWIMIWSCSGPL